MNHNDIVNKERLTQTFSDFKTLVLPQIRTAIEQRAKKTALTAAVERITAIEALIGNATAADEDNVVNKVLEMIDFFTGITEDKTLAGMLETMRQTIMTEVNRCNVTIEAQTAPDENTLTYTTGTGQSAVVHNHIVGDKRIVPNAESDEGYTMYFLLAIENGAAKWSESAGGSGDARAKLRVTLTSNQTGDNGLEGIIVSIKRKSDDSAVDERLWEGETLLFKLSPQVEYVVSVESKAGYALDYQSRTITPEISGEHSMTFNYSKTKIVFAPLSNQSGDTEVSEKATGTINGTSVNYGGYVFVPTGSNVQIVCNAIAGYATPNNGTAQTVVAAGAEMTPALTYQTDIYTISITSNQTNDSAIDGKQVGVTFGGNTVQKGNGQTVKVPTGTTPTAAADDIAGYKKTVTVTAGAKTIVAAYETTLVSVTPASNQGSADAILTGMKFTINGSSQVSAGEPVKVPTGDAIVVTSPDVAHYAKVLSGGGTAAGTSQIVTVSYSTTKVTVSMTADDTENNVPPTGAKAIVKYTDDNSTEQSQEISSGGTALVPTGKVFRIDFSACSGYGSPESKTNQTATGTAMTYDQNEYVAGALTINLSATVNGSTAQLPAGAKAYVKIDGGEWQEYTQTMSVQPGSTVQVKYDAVEGYTTPTAVAQFTKLSGETVLSAVYESVTYVVNIESNQSSDSVIAEKKATLSYTYGSSNFSKTNISNGQSVNVPASGVTNLAVTADDATGYKKDVSQSGTTFTVSYKTTILTVNKTVNATGTAADISSATATVYDNTDASNPVVIAAEQNGTWKVPIGTPVKVVFSDANEHYKTPDAVTATYTNATSEATATITGEYKTEVYLLNVSDNQGNSDVSATVIRVTFGTAHQDFTGAQTNTQVKVPYGTVPTVAAQSNAPSSSDYKESIAVDSSAKTITVQYQAELVTVTLTADDSADMSGQSVAVTVSGSNKASGTGAVSTKIPFGTEYGVSLGSKDGYTTPDTSVKYTASQALRQLSYQYVYNPIETGYIILDQSVTDPTKKVQDANGKTYSDGYTRPAVIDQIRAASHRYVGTFNSSTKVMSLKQLDDSDGTKYADGTSAANDIKSTAKDVFMRLPEFYTKATLVSTDKWKIEFAFGGNPGDGWKKWGGNDLIGAYKGYSTGSKLYSISGQASTASISQANFKAYARARGDGYTLVKHRHQNIMAILFYAYYGHTNCQTICGTGANSRNRTTGQKDSFGMTDTTSANGNANNVMFWGLENWWGDLYEWEDNVVVNNGTWTITEDDGSTRTLTAGTDVMTAAGSWVYPSKFAIGDNLDTVGAVGQSGGSDSQGYCDGQYIANSSSRVVARSCYFAGAFCGVAYVDAARDSSYSGTYFGSRLAFIGEIEIV